ncbi:hypothetical protein CCR95_14955 [Thiocystis minor]|uniref:hypothetical protein n=1 Tax=Thiocystis minor TaxID=61597 RepID=UPI0019143024|nr:hypothetical protein [Thiocystis minor]MBK5965349.1 hypothetical protein [Thiocystis minor]
MALKNRSLHLGILVCAILVLPLLVVRFPPFLDYYSHLARVYIHANLSQFSDFYAYNSITPPNVALDIVIGAFHALFGIETAGRLFLVAIIFLQVSGLWILNRRLLGPQSVPIGPLLGGALLYNWPLSMGFLNYLFGLGVMLWIIWLWLLIQEKGLSQRVVLGTLFCLLLYYMHLIVFALYFLVIIGYGIQNLAYSSWTSAKEQLLDFVVTCIPFVPPVYLYATTLGGDSRVTQLFPHPLAEKWSVFIGSLSSGTFDPGSAPTDPGLVCLAILVGAAMILGKVRFSRDMALPILLVTLAFLLAPGNYGEAGYIVDRLPLGIALLGCASIRIDFRESWKTTLITTSLVAFLLIKGVYLSMSFSVFDVEMRRIHELLGLIKPGSTIIVGIDVTNPRHSGSDPERAYWHVASLAALRSPVFVATTHANRSQQTIVPSQAPYTDLYAWQRQLPIELAGRKDLAKLVNRYDEIMSELQTEDAERARYLILLRPYGLAGLARDFGDVIGTTNQMMLIELPPAAIVRNVVDHDG